MVSPPELSHHFSMAKNSLRGRAFPCFTDGCLFLGGALMALLLVWSFSAFVFPNPRANSPEEALAGTRIVEDHCRAARVAESPQDPPDKTFYDDPGVSYTIEKPVKGWDEKRKEWLRRHPSFAGGRERIVLVTGSQAAPCRNKIGDHLLLRFFKNKVDYCRLHGCDVFYNNVLLQPKMHTYWAKYPAVRAAMLAHPEAEWIWWVDSDALFTDMDFTLPLDRYRDHNLVVHGWAHLVHDKKSWTSINAGIFLIRNCQWSMDFMDVWASTGPQSPDYERWGKVLSSTFKDKIFPESDDQSALIYLILKHPDLYGNKIYIENEYYFQGYWVDIVPSLDNITRRYTEIESGEGEDASVLRRRHAEKVSEFYRAQWEPHLQEAGYGLGSWRRPFITHFTGCQPCSGDHNQMYSGETCWSGMVRALNFADNQVLRNYGFIHPDLLDSATVEPIPFDYPAARSG
ncbi:putative glycosyltransferase 7 [Punica granatum]|uniref:Uncharacterized protein n=2 Tax=Punica granatum TaxID=22663 RepID=A0A218XC50_PUNGR|nr:putative glycosyltransferase 7 [Punica granatum]OWM82091.1 hypothetical protein CDL15_Pgr001665 [Punica granatum]PKI44867.1 hypothetical protein CRG98_034815 [Punica granatum]